MYSAYDAMPPLSLRATPLTTYCTLWFDMRSTNAWCALLSTGKPCRLARKMLVGKISSCTGSPHHRSSTAGSDGKSAVSSSAG
jgi:hypothetical protein